MSLSSIRRGSYASDNGHEGGRFAGRDGPETEVTPVATVVGFTPPTHFNCRITVPSAMVGAAARFAPKLPGEKETKTQGARSVRATRKPSTSGPFVGTMPLLRLAERSPSG
jgi:hypothetical protein